MLTPAPLIIHIAGRHRERAGVRIHARSIAMHNFACVTALFVPTQLVRSTNEACAEQYTSFTTLPDSRLPSFDSLSFSSFKFTPPGA